MLKDVSVSVTKLDAKQNIIELQVGPFGVTMELSEFKKLAVGDTIDPQAVIRNVAVMAGLNNVDVTDQESLKNMLSNTTFKF